MRSGLALLLCFFLSACAERRLVSSGVARSAQVTRIAQAPPVAAAPKAAAPVEPQAPYQVVLAPSSSWLMGPGGAQLLELRPELRVAVASAGPGRRAPLAARTIRFPPWQVRRSGQHFTLETHASAGPLRYHLELASAAGQLALSLESEALQAVQVRAEVLELRSGAVEAAVVDHALRWVPLRGPSFASQLDAPYLRLARGAALLTLQPGPGLQGLRVQPLGGGRQLLQLELDHEENHPFRPLLACSRQGRPLRRALGESLRQAGSRRQLRARLLVGEGLPPLLGRYPRGARAAVVLTDHADQSSAAKLEALAFGATGAVSAGRLGPAYPGLVNRGLAYTKSVFVRKVPGYARQLDSLEYRQLLARLQGAGVELALHSVTGALDSRARLQQLLGEFRAITPGRSWIDHQPSSNCEAISNQGWNPASPFHSLDLLQQAGFRYFWSGDDLTRPASSLNLFAPEQPDRRRPLLYRFPRQGDVTRQEEVWLFDSTLFFLQREQVVAELSEPALQRLEEEHGLLIAHVYLDTYQKRGRRAPRSLLELGDGPGRYRLRPEVDRAFQRLAAHQGSGRLWVTGIDSLVDHLRARTEVDLREAGSGVIEIRSPTALPALTLLLPAGAGRASIDGRAPDGERTAATGPREIWFDLPAGSPRLLRLDGGGRSLLAVGLRELTHD